MFIDKSDWIEWSSFRSEMNFAVSLLKELSIYFAHACYKHLAPNGANYFEATILEAQPPLVLEMRSVPPALAGGSEGQLHCRLRRSPDVYR